MTTADETFRRLSRSPVDQAAAAVYQAWKQHIAKPGRMWQEQRNGILASHGWTAEEYLGQGYSDIGLKNLSRTPVGTVL